MRNRIVTTGSFGLTLALLMSVGISTSARAADKPNILFIMGDDIGWMQPSIYHRGLMVGETPNIDRIGHEGAKFMTYYAEQSCTAGRTAFFGFVEEDHRGPAALPALFGHIFPIDAVLEEVVVMRLELLADFINLPLQRFPMARINAHQRADAAFNLFDERIVRGQVAAVAGPEVRVRMFGKQARWLTPLVDQGYQLFALGGRHEILHAIQCEIILFDNLRASRGFELARHDPAKIGQPFLG